MVTECVGRTCCPCLGQTCRLRVPTRFGKPFVHPQREKEQLPRSGLLHCRCLKYDFGPMPKHSLNILELARKGAEVKYQELQSEIAVLVRQFPHLRRVSGGGNEHSFRLGTETALETSEPRRQRAKMSAAGKKAVSLRMKKYWSERRAAQAKK